MLFSYFSLIDGCFRVVMLQMFFKIGTNNHISEKETKFIHDISGIERNIDGTNTSV